jgi:hypothetical protein
VLVFLKTLGVEGKNGRVGGLQQGNAPGAGDILILIRNVKPYGKDSDH